MHFKSYADFLKRRDVRNFLLVGLLCSSLGACITTGGGTSTGGGNVSQVQQLAKQACGFLPLAKTVLAIFASGLNTATQVADAVCQAVTSNPMAGGPGKRVRFGRVNGVHVEGTLVKRR